MSIDLKKYKVLIGYGIGQYYEIKKGELDGIAQLDYLCDRKWEQKSGVTEYDGIRIIKRSELAQLKDALVIVFTERSWIYEAIRQDLADCGLPIVHIHEIVAGRVMLTGKEIKAGGTDGKYVDDKNNRIYFDDSLSDNIRVLLYGKNSELRIEKGVIIEKLCIAFGNDGRCSIGENSEIIGAEFFVAGARLSIGKDCLFSNGILVRNHDGHHIFDAASHERINHPKDIIIEDQVWIGYRATVLAGARIGCGSIIGTGAVTSGQFRDHVIIAGCPAQILRENVCWSRDNTDYFNRDHLEECISQEALRYL